MALLKDKLKLHTYFRTWYSNAFLKKSNQKKIIKLLVNFFSFLLDSVY